MHLARRTLLSAALSISLLSLAACSGGTTTLSGSGANSGTGSSGSLVVGTADFSENEILGYLYADVLNQAGIKTSVKPNLGSREIILPALQHGDIDLLPEYQGSLLLYFDPKATQSSSDAVQTALAAKLPAGLKILPPAAAEDADVFAVTRKTADKYSLHSLADLAAHNGQLVFGGSAEDKTRQVGIVGLKSVYGVEFKSFKALDPDGPLTKGALKNGDIDVANLFSTDSDIATNNDVVLTDPKNLIPAQHIVPLIRADKSDPRIAAALAKLNSTLTTADLTKLDSLVDTGHQDPDTVANTWAKAHGLTG